MTLLEALVRFDLSKRQVRVVIAIIRKTVDFRKSEDGIPASQLANLTGFDKTNIVRALNDLDELGVITKRKGKYGQILSLNGNCNSCA